MPLGASLNERGKMGAAEAEGARRSTPGVGRREGAPVNESASPPATRRARSSPAGDTGRRGSRPLGAPAPALGLAVAPAPTPSSAGPSSATGEPPRGRAGLPLAELRGEAPDDGRRRVSLRITQLSQPGIPEHRLCEIPCGVTRNKFSSLIVCVTQEAVPAFKVCMKVMCNVICFFSIIACVLLCTHISIRVHTRRGLHAGTDTHRGLGHKHTCA